MIFKRREKEKACQNGEGKYDIECRKNPFGAPPIEAQEAEGSRAQLGEDMPADQVARDDKEDIDAGIASGNHRRACVIEHDARYGDGPNSIYVRTV